MTISTPTLTDIATSLRTAIATRLPGGDATPPRSVLGVLAKTVAGGIDGLYGAIETVAAEIVYDTATSDYLARWAGIWGITRTAPVAASGTVVFTGTALAAVPVGTLLARSDGLQYKLTSAVVLSAAGSGSGSVTCTAAGSVTNTDDSATLQLVSPVAGIASTATVSGGLGAGADLEGDTSLRNRLLTRIRQTPQGGSAADFKEWALSVAGVTNVWVYSWWQGCGTVGITFLMAGRTNPIPLAADVAAVQAAIDAVRPVGCHVFVFAPTPQPLAFAIHLMPDSTAIRTAVEAELSDLIARETTPGGTLDLTHIQAAISAAAGEVDYTLAAPTTNVTAPAGSIVTLGAIAWA